MATLSLISYIVFKVGITLGVGSSTFALINFIIATKDGEVDASERRLMHAVYVVLRVGMVLIAIGLLSSLFFGLSLSGQYLMQWILLGVITINAILMTVHVMPMRFGPVLAGGSWYSLFFVTEIPPVAFLPLPMLLGSYAAFLIVFFIIFEFIKKRVKETNA